MNKLKTYSNYLLLVLAGVLIAITVVSLFYNLSTLWWIKSLNFPRLQLFIIALLLLLLVILTSTKSKPVTRVVVAALAICAVIHISFIYPYTTVAGKQVVNATAHTTASQPFSLFIANVKMKNRKADVLLSMIQQQQPDIILLMETDHWWLQQVQPIRQQYPYKIEQPLNNTYGMLLYSKFPLHHSQIKFIEHNRVPSFHTQIMLPNNRPFNFHGVHPVPPVSSKKHPDNVGEDAGELHQVGQLVAQNNQPAVVAGDFNDVAWSNISRLFKKAGRLNDVRVGRGLYNTFSAHSWVMRWPLDHVFVTHQFKLVSLKRLPYFGSDHFPIYVQLVLTPDNQ